MNLGNKAESLSDAGETAWAAASAFPGWLSGLYVLPPFLLS